jgi:hypothetical protein
VSRTTLLWLLVAATLFLVGATTTSAIPTHIVRAELPVSQHKLGFGQAPLGIAWPDDTTWGNWYSLHDGFGRTAVVKERMGRMLRISTRSPINPSESYSSLVHSTRSFGDIDFTVRVRTVKQHRPVPKPWEVGWVLWRYTDNEHFYSFIVKPDGWELAKQDASYPGKQRFLAYSYARTFPTGRTYSIRIRQIENHVRVWVDGRQLVAFRDDERPYRKGSIALYAEDSAVLYSPVELRPVSESSRREFGEAAARRRAAGARP